MAETADVIAPASLAPVLSGSLEGLYFRLVVRGLGYDPSSFSFWKFVKRGGGGFNFGVFRGGAGAVYKADKSESWKSQFAQDLRAGRFNPQRPPALHKDKLLALGDVLAAFEHGLDAGLSALNQRVPHRFTALYRLQGGEMCNVALTDKERSIDASSLKALPLTYSFCRFALRDGFFLTARSGTDERLAGRPYSVVVGSYVGVPIAVGENTLYGTLCHFDFSEQQIDQQEFFLLQHVALSLPRRLLTQAWAH